jgi:hypothetical protein
MRLRAPVWPMQLREQRLPTPSVSPPTPFIVCACPDSVMRHYCQTLSTTLPFAFCIELLEESRAPPLQWTSMEQRYALHFSPVRAPEV